MAKRKYNMMSGGPSLALRAFKKYRGSRRVPRKYKGLMRTSGFYGRFRGGNFGQELKFLDNAISFTFDSTNEIPATGQLCIIAQGDTQSQRDGRRVIVKSIYVNCLVTLVPAAAAQSSTMIYLWLVQDTQCNGAAATVADDNTGIFTSSGTAPYAAVRCLANGNRFKILKHWIKKMESPAGVTGAFVNVSSQIQQYIKCHIPIEYDASATTGALTTIRSNNLFLVAGSSAADDLTSCLGTIRLRFIG